MELDEFRERATELSPWAHLATVGSDGAPDVVPVHPAWENGVIWFLVGRTSVKARNVAAEPRVALHWQVTERGDGAEIWGTATVHDDIEVKRRLWTGVFDYDLSAFAPGGPEGSPDMGFMAVRPVRAMFITAYGMGGIERWNA
jgi:general stress protein 26